LLEFIFLYLVFLHIILGRLFRLAFRF